MLVNAALRTSDPDVFAAGDVANVAHPLLGRRVRVEHWANALNGGPAAARSMLGQPVSSTGCRTTSATSTTWAWRCSGLPEPGFYDQIVYRGEGQMAEFIAFWLHGGCVVAGMNVNVWDVTDAIQALIRAGYAGPTGRRGAAGRPDGAAGCRAGLIRPQDSGDVVGGVGCPWAGG